MPWALVLLCFAVSLQGQTLARPGWAGSGLRSEAWWQNAVFYRITPATFQDSDGDGIGDLQGIALRLDYLQSLGVDAIVLAPPFDQAGFDDLLSEASRRHVRVLVEVASGTASSTLAEARAWLTRGTAGVWLHLPPKADAQQTVSNVMALRSLVDSFPGQRVLVVDVSADPAQLGAAGAQLVTRVLKPGIGDQTDAVSLRVQLAQIPSVPQGSMPTIYIDPYASPSQSFSKEKIWTSKVFAAALLLSRGAAVIAAGEEIDFPANSGEGRVMQWTPSNVTRPTAAKLPSPPPPPPRREDEYGAFVPYVPPKPSAATGATDLDALPGFSAGLLPRDRAYDVTSVAAQDADGNSLLNFYRRLTQIHHENAAAREGATVLLNFDADNVLAWVRKASPGARTSSSILAIANLSATAKTISAADPSLRLQSGSGLRTLLSSSPQNAQYVQRSTAVTVAPQSIIVLDVRR